MLSAVKTLKQSRAIATEKYRSADISGDYAAHQPGPKRWSFPAWRAPVSVNATRGNSLMALAEVRRGCNNRIQSC